MSKRNTQVIALAGAVALAGFGYTLVRRSRSRSAAPRAPRASIPAQRRAEQRRADARPTPSERAPWSENERTSSAPDALDVALNLDGLFDGTSAEGAELTARPDLHLPRILGGDDEEARAPEDLGAAWLTQATESERSLSFADTIPNFDDLDLPKASKPSTADYDSVGDDRDDQEVDETTAEYVRLHRISSVG